MTELPKMSIDDILAMVNEEAQKKYAKTRTKKHILFKKENGELFNIFAFPDEPSICVEYAENEEEADLWRFEDGDRFYLEDFQSLEALTEAIFAEIDS